MTSRAGQVTAGRVGRAHGLDGSFYVDHVSEPLDPGTDVTVSGRVARVERRAGTDDRPIVRLSGVGDRNAAEALRGERILVDGGELSEGEYLTADLVGCEVPGLGVVRRVIAGPSCDVLEVGDGAVLVPFISDAVRSVDTDARVIEVDTAFLDIGSGGSPS
ncbi:MAG: rRNA processing protein RimM [Thermoleophilaceae bacterium]|nr:rRNA processing protein RimM [Thermoleophilaceae bacterium]